MVSGGLIVKLTGEEVCAPPAHAAAVEIVTGTVVTTATAGISVASIVAEESVVVKVVATFAVPLKLMASWGIGRAPAPSMQKLVPVRASMKLPGAPEVRARGFKLVIAGV